MEPLKNKYFIKIEMDKAVNGLAPEYLSTLYKRNSESRLWVLQNTRIDLQRPKKASKKDKTAFLVEVYNHAMPFHSFIL